MQNQLQHLRSENSRLQEGGYLLFFSSLSELKSMKRSLEVSVMPAAPSDQASLQSMMNQTEQDSETKAKIRRYIVENSELRLQLDRERQQHEESLNGKELEYEQSSVTLKEEFSKKLAENRELREAGEEKDRELAEKREALTDLREVVISQKSKIAEQETVRDGETGLMNRPSRRRKRNSESGKSDSMDFGRHAMSSNENARRLKHRQRRTGESADRYP